MKKLIPILCLIFSGCDVLTDEGYDCLDNDKPEFDIKDFPVATLNQVYSQEVHVYLVREPEDSLYHYEFTIDGDLPNGIELIADDYSRTALFYGVPTELGDFHFNLHVRVTDPEDLDDSDYEEDEYDDGDDLCRNTVERDYTLSVEIEQ